MRSKLLVVGVLLLVLVGSVSGYYTEKEMNLVNSYGIDEREDCLLIENDEIYNDCIRFYNNIGFKLGDPLIGYRE